MDLKDKVAVVTGAGRGIGREIAVLLAKEGAKVVVNDFGGSEDGTGGEAKVADDVVKDIQAAGGAAVGNYDAVGSMEAGKKMIQTAAGHFWLRPWRDLFFDLKGINIVGVRIDIHKDRGCSCPGDHPGCGKESEGRDENFVSGSNPQEPSAIGEGRQTLKPLQWHKAFDNAGQWLAPAVPPFDLK